MEDDCGITFIPFMGSSQQSGNKSDSRTTSPKTKRSRKPSAKSLGKRRLAAESDIGSDAFLENSRFHEVGIPPNQALAMFDDLPIQYGFDGSIRRLHAYRRVWNRWANAIEATAARRRRSSISLARSLLINPYHPTASSPWLDPELQELDGNLRNLLINHNIHRLGTGKGLGLGWDEEMVFMILSGVDLLATSRALSQVVQGLSSNIGSSENAEHMDSDTGPLRGSSFQPFAVLKAQDCKDVQAAVRSLIAGFVQQYEEFLEPVPKQKAGHTLAPDDIERLKAWWRYLTSEKTDPSKRFKDKTLLVVIPAMEDVPLTVLNDLTLLLATELADLPFAVLTTSGLSNAYFDRLDRETRDYIRLKVIEIPCGFKFIEQVLEEVCWGVDGESERTGENGSNEGMEFDEQDVNQQEDDPMGVEVLLSSDFLSSLLDYSERNDSSLDALLSFIQIKLMHHFSNPLTSLLPSSLPPYELSELESKPEMPLFATLLGSFFSGEAASLSDAFEKQRNEFRAYQYLYQMTFRLFRFLEKFFTERMKVIFASPKALKLDPHAKRVGMKDLCHPEWQEKVIDKLQEFLQKMSEERLEELRIELITFLERQTNKVLLEKLITSVRNAETSATMAGAIINNIDRWRTSPEERITLSFLWILDDNDVSSPLLNPSPHYSLLAGILNAQELLTSDAVETELDPEERGKQDEVPPPDLAVLFERYLEAGRMINVFDLFRSFATVVNAQRSQANKRKEQAKAEFDAQVEAQKDVERKERKARPRSESPSKKRKTKATLEEDKAVKRGRGWVEVEFSDEEVEDEEEEDLDHIASPTKSPSKRKLRSRMAEEVADDEVEHIAPEQQKRKTRSGLNDVGVQSTPRRSSRRNGKEGDAIEDAKELRTRSQSPRKASMRSTSPIKVQTPSRSRRRLPTPPIPDSEEEEEEETKDGEEEDGKEDGEEEDPDPIEDPEIKIRFLYAMHELDYLGFFRPTGRKADHLLKTRFEAV